MIRSSPIEAAKHAMEEVGEADCTFEVLDADKAELSAKDYDAKWNPKYAVMNAEPQTAAGAVALLIFAAENLAEQWLFDHDKIVPVLANAARAIADAPITSSKGLADVVSGKRMSGEA